MILYLDTSAVVKLYAAEAGSAAIRRLVAEAEQIASSLLAYSETRAALARKHRMRQIGQREFDTSKDEFESHWAGFFRLPVDPEVVRLAGGLAERFGLRAYDALHLATAALLQTAIQAPVTFASADRLLNAAAAKMGMALIPGA